MQRENKPNDEKANWEEKGKGGQDNTSLIECSHTKSHLELMCVHNTRAPNTIYLCLV